MWQPIETAPKDNKHPLFLARFNDDGTLQSFDYNGSWESEYESWEMPEVYYFWASENGNVEEPTHWMYQPSWFDALPGAQPAPSIPEGWKLVPIEPTDEMVRIATAEYVQACSRRLHPNIAWRQAFKSMLAAAPNERSESPEAKS